MIISIHFYYKNLTIQIVMFTFDKFWMSTLITILTIQRQNWPLIISGNNIIQILEAPLEHMSVSNSISVSHIDCSMD